MISEAWYKGACKYYISTLGVGEGLKEMLILLMWLGAVGVQRQNAYIAYVRDQNSYSPENGFQICEISLNSVVKGHI